MATELPSSAAVYDTNITHSLRVTVSFAIKAHSVSGSLLSLDNYFKTQSNFLSSCLKRYFAKIAWQARLNYLEFITHIHR